MPIPFIRPIVISALLWICAAPALAQDHLPIPVDEFVYCSTCHGVQLMGNHMVNAPRLSGFDAWYVEQQLAAFKKEWRGDHMEDIFGMEMQPMAAALSDKQIKAVARYVNKTRSAPPASTIAGNIDNGRRLYESCSACHGASGEGIEALNSPALTTTNDWYLVTQLQQYKNGSRGSHAADRYGSQMRAAAELLTDDDAIIDVVTYIASLR